MTVPADDPPTLADIWHVGPDLSSEEARRVLDLARRMHLQRGGLD